MASAALEIAELFCFRALPMAIAALCMRGVSAAAKGVLGAGLAALVLGLRSVDPAALEGLPVAYAYLLAACALLPLLARAVRARRVSAGGAFVLCTALLFLGPALLWPMSSKVAALVICWDLMLRGYSYCVEVGRSDRNARLSLCWFFLLVDPVLVYTQRSSRVAPVGLDRRGLARALLGLLVLFGASALLVPLAAAARVAGESGAGATWLWLAGTGALRFAIEYARQSGLASLQIGLMRQLGYQTPERFIHPLAACGFDDFWRRWNTYVGQWMLRYVFTPFTLVAGRGFRGRRARTPIVAAGVLVTFAATGFLHDLHVYALTSRMNAHALGLFVANGVLVLVWLVLGSLGARLGDGAGWANLRVAAAFASRFALWTGAAAFFALWWT